MTSRDHNLGQLYNYNGIGPGISERPPEMSTKKSLSKLTTYGAVGETPDSKSLLRCFYSEKWLRYFLRYDFPIVKERALDNWLPWRRLISQSERPILNPNPLKSCRKSCRSNQISLNKTLLFSMNIYRQNTGLEFSESEDTPMDRYGVGLLKTILFLVLISGGRSEIPGPITRT